MVMTVIKRRITSTLTRLNNVHDAPPANRKQSLAELLTDANCFWQANRMIPNIALWGIPHNNSDRSFTLVNRITTFTSYVAAESAAKPNLSFGGKFHGGLAEVFFLGRRLTAISAAIRVYCRLTTSAAGVYAWLYLLQISTSRVYSAGLT